MTYQAIICKIKTRPHPNADKLLIGNANGYQVLVSKDTQDNTLGIYFPCDGQLSLEFCKANKLLREDGGYFENNRRVKTIKLRGEISEGFWCPIDHLYYIGEEVLNNCRLKIDHKFTHVGKHKICDKYLTQATRAARSKSKNPKKDTIPTFPKHYDTEKLRNGINDLSECEVFYFTEKLHGTSGRSAYVQVETWPWYRRIFKWIGVRPALEWQKVGGTRNCILPDSPSKDEKGKNYRLEAHRKVSEHLRQNEIVYYEIVGYEGNETLIMPAHKYDTISSSDQKKLRKKYGDSMKYTYGCEPGEFKVYVYRITYEGKDLSREELETRCKNLGLNVVPILYKHEGLLSNEEILKKAEELSQGNSILCNNHIREGVCVNGEKPFKKAQKYKSWWFCHLEGIRKNDDNYIDPEEIA